MAEIKDKLVTVESLAILHEDNKNAFMVKNDPVGIGTMTMEGNANFTGNINVGSFTIGSKVKLVPTENSLEIVFINDEEVTEEN